MNARLALFASLTALALSAIACYRVLRPPTSYRSLYTYDLSSPEATLRSLTEASAEGNRFAEAESDGHASVPAARLKLRTVQVHKEMEANGRKLLFISYDREKVPKPADNPNAVERHQDVEAFEKDLATGKWYKVGLGDFVTDDARKAIAEWEAQPAA